MYIGEAAKRTGLSIKAIRLYEEKGLIPSPERVGRYRVYRDSDLEILLLIREAREIGISLAQLKQVFNYSNGEVDWKYIKQFLKEVRVQLVSSIENLEKKIEILDQCYEQINA